MKCCLSCLERGTGGGLIRTIALIGSSFSRRETFHFSFCYLEISHEQFFIVYPSPSDQYVTKASSTVRAALKEPAKSKAMAQESFSYNRSVWSGGNQGAKKLTDSLAAVGK